MKKQAPSPSTAPDRAEVAYNLLMAAGVSPAEIGEAAVRLTLTSAPSDADFVAAMLNLIEAAIEVQRDWAAAGVNSCECSKCSGQEDELDRMKAVVSGETVLFIPRLQGDES